MSQGSTRITSHQPVPNTLRISFVGTGSSVPTKAFSPDPGPSLTRSSYGSQGSGTRSIESNSPSRSDERLRSRSSRGAARPTSQITRRSSRDQGRCPAPRSRPSGDGPQSRRQCRYRSLPTSAAGRRTNANCPHRQSAQPRRRRLGTRRTLQRASAPRDNTRCSRYVYSHQRPQGFRHEIALTSTATDPTARVRARRNGRQRLFVSLLIPPTWRRAATDVPTSRNTIVANSS